MTIMPHFHHSVCFWVCDKFHHSVCFWVCDK